MVSERSRRQKITSMAKRIQENPIDVAEMPVFNDRQFYNNAVVLPSEHAQTHPGYALPRSNVRRVNSKKRAKTSNVVGILFLVATAALLYVGNVIAVNTLAKEVNDLNARYSQIISTNEVIKAEINRKASLERISLMAQERLGMVNPKEAPQWFDVDPEKVNDIQQRLTN